jgi:predicted metallo-beta-lactamase superfamily hydrolase
MELVEIGVGEIKACMLAFESLGVRSMATYVETADVKLVIDPGSALGPRFKLNPHEREYIALAASRERILEAARQADILTISHYHFDHYVPNFEDWLWIWSSPEIAAKLYKGKLILAKDIKTGINPSQRKRGYMFQKLTQPVAKEIISADGKIFNFGDTSIEFSKPVYHGPVGSKLGYVLMVTVRTPNCCLIHAPDIQGPMYAEPLELIVEKKPDVVVMGGPPIYLEGFKVELGDLELARENLVKLAKHVRILVVDHHLLRSTDYVNYLKEAVYEAKKHGNRVLSAAEFMGKEPQLLEARRRELHEEQPIERGWYERLRRGEFREGLRA